MPAAEAPAARGGAGAAAPAEAAFNVPQALVLCLVNLNEACAGNIIWPFLPFLTARYARAEDVGVYTGVLASAFFFGQALAVSSWGAAADRYGRRPVILLGLAGSAATML